MKILIVDYEALARERLVAMLAEAEGGYEVVGEAANGTQAIKLSTSIKPDILLLDIHMPGMSGLEVAMHLSEQEDAPAIIFTTAYDEYALAAFEAQAIAYLLKPVQAEQLLRSLQKASQLKQGQLQELQSATGSQRSHISVKTRGDLQLVPTSDVMYFRADQKYVEMRHPGGVALIEESLKSLEEEFPDRFMRIHRNALIATDAVMGIERDGLGRCYAVLSGCDEKLDVSRRHVTALRQLLKSRG